MQSANIPPQTAHSAVYISPELLSDFERRLKEPPRKLTELAGKTSCCIFRVPKSLSEINEKAYQPHIVSIGPYHHGDPKFSMIQEHKWRLVGHLLRRIEPTGVRHKHLFDAVAPLEEIIRDSYSETLDFSGSDLIEMMVLDGCFIIEMFCKVGRLVPADSEDPLFTMAWVLPFLMRDLLMLENQIPYSVLKTLFDLCLRNPSPNSTSNSNSCNSNSNSISISSNSSSSSSSSSSSLGKLALGFFNYMVQRPGRLLERYYDYDAPHLLALFRETYLPPTKETSGRVPKKSLQLIKSARKLHMAGVKFRPRQAETFLDIRFRYGLLEIPLLIIDDFSSAYFLNFVAYEQCYSHSTQYITSYATFMGCLVNTPSDAGFLCDQKVMESYFGTDEEVARFFNNIGKDVVFDIQRSYLSEVFEEVNEYYMNNWHVRWAEFRHTYFDSPWSFVSAMAALMLLLLTMVQAFFAAYSYITPPSNKSNP